MEDLTTVVPVLRGLRDLGVQLWIDDFGTGYSSLEYLRRLPLDGLKVDRAFIADVATKSADSAIVAGILNLAHSLGLQALAEGVESEAQAIELTRLGYELGQGWHWSAACPPDDLERWVGERLQERTTP
jgi:sensor c-di-GMP phosphodiesterase-like protein